MTTRSSNTWTDTPCSTTVRLRSKVEGEGKENWYRFEVDGICVRKHHVRGTWEGPVVSQTGRAAAEKDHLEPPRLLRRLPAPSVPMSRLAEELPGIMFRKAGMTE